MKKLTFIFSIILLSAMGASAQSDTSGHMWLRRNLSGVSQLQVSYRPYNFNALNSALGSAGIPALSNNDVWIVAAMSKIHNKWISEDGLGFTLNSTAEANNIKTRFNQYQAFIREGYNLSNNKSFRAYPFIGVNFTMAVLNIQDNAREQNVTNFTQELLNSTSSKTLYQGNFGLEFGAGFDYSIQLKPKTLGCVTIQRSIPVGIRAGYYLNTYAGNWKINDYNLNNGPNNKQNAVFVTLTIGLGYEVNKH